MYTPSIFFLDKLLNQMLDHAVAGPFSGILDGCFVGLGQFPTPVLNPTQGVSAITEATYDGYARLPLTWHGPYLNPLGQPSIQTDGNYFVPTGATVSNQIVMMFIADALTAGNLLLSTPLPGGPVFLSNTLTALGLAQVFNLLTGNNYGTPLVIQ